MADVRLWHLADIPITLPNVGYWGQSGHRNRTAQMSAFDPKRTFILAISLI